MPNVRAIVLLIASVTCVVTLFVSGLTLTAHLAAEPAPHHFAHMDTPDLWTSEPVVVNTAKQAYERIEAAPVVAYLAPTDGDVETAALAHTEERGTAVADSQSEGAQSAASQVATSQSAPLQFAASHSSDALSGDSGGVIASADGTRTEAAQADWCLDRYRSYRVEDNSYQPNGGGPRKQCEAPSIQTSGFSQARDQATATFGADGRDGMARLSAVSAAKGMTADASAGQATAAMGAAAGGSHEEWCHERYRSYRSEDNSYQPFDGGPRKACASPYG